MKTIRRCLLLALLACVPHVWAQDVVRIVVGFPPGGSIDSLARGVAQSWLENSGQTVVVENQPGAGSLLAAQSTARAQPDGRTLLLAPVVVPAFMPHLYRKLAFDPIADLVPVVELGTFNFALIVGADVPVNTLSQWITYCTDHPGKVQFGSLGAGTPAHFLGSMLNHAAGINMLHVPYKGAAPAMQAVLSGEVQAAFMLTGGLTAQQLRAGKVKALAVTGSARSPSMPNVPTFAEAGAGLKEMANASLWYGFFAPKGTSAADVNKLQLALSAALNTPRMQALLAREDLTADTTTTAAFAAKVRRDHRNWGEVIRATGFTLDN